jgi:hypothetical protein
MDFTSAPKPLNAEYWTVVICPKTEMRVEPSGIYISVAWFSSFVCLALIPALWLLGNTPFDFQVFFAAWCIVLSIVVHNFFRWVHRSEESLGPYIVLNENGIRLREGVKIEWEDFVSVEVFSQWDGKLADEITSLIINCDSGDKITVMQTVYPKAFVKLKGQLDQAIDEIRRAAQDN